MNLPLTVKLFFVVVFLRQAGFHLFEALVVHLGRIDVAADDFGSERFGELNTQVDSRIRMV